jgi:hypothetical protein
MGKAETSCHMVRNKQEERERKESSIEGKFKKKYKESCQLTLMLLQLPNRICAIC